MVTRAYLYGGDLVLYSKGGGECRRVLSKRATCYRGCDEMTNVCSIWETGNERTWCQGDSLLNFYKDTKECQIEENDCFQAKPGSVAPVECAFNQHPEVFFYTCCSESSHLTLTPFPSNSLFRSISLDLCMRHQISHC